MKQSPSASGTNSIPTGLFGRREVIPVLSLSLSLSTSHVVFLLETLLEVFEAPIQYVDKKDSAYKHLIILLKGLESSLFPKGSLGI